MFKKGFVPIIIVLIIALLVAGGITSYLFIKNKQPKIIGGDTDFHGCLIAAGYSWCEAQQKCLRTWEEPCDETTITTSTTTTTEMFKCGDSVTFTYKGSIVTYGTVKNITTGECWLDRNLGALQVATSYSDSLAYGDLFQWGRSDDGHQTRTSGTTTVLSNSDNPGHSNFIYGMASPYDWHSPQNNNLWQGVSGINNPCPSGWRLPTSGELDAERASWSQQNYNGAYSSLLKLTATGGRHYSNASLYDVGDAGYYWSSTVNGTLASTLAFGASRAFMYDYYRVHGFSVRCLED